MRRIRAIASMALLVIVLGAPTAVRAQAVHTGVTLGLANEELLRESQAGEPSGSEGLSDNTKQGIGCLAAGAGSLVFADYWAGAAESIMVIAGGVLVPSVTPTLWLALTSTMVAATCTLAATATPFVLWVADQRNNILANVAWQMRRTATDVAGLFIPAGPSEPVQVAGSGR